MQGLSPVAASGGHSSSRCMGLSLSRPLPLQSTGSRRAGSVIVATGPAALRHMGSSQTRARTRVPCTGRQTLNHCAPGKPTFHDFDVLFHIFMFILLLLIVVIITFTENFLIFFLICVLAYLSDLFSNCDFLFPIDSYFFSI